MRRILIIGGTTFMGYQLVWRLVAAGHTVTVLNRGKTPDSFGNRVARIHVDRTAPAFAHALDRQEFDAVVDFAAYTAEDVSGAVAALRGRVGHYIFISSGATYVVRAGVARPCEAPFPESAFDGRLSDAPTAPEDLASWQYGAHKRAAEAVLVQAWAAHRFPATRVRLPSVNGERDPSRRLESYLWRILDGGPVVLPDGGMLTRHVYSGDVVLALDGLLGRADTFGEAFNLSQDEEPTLRELVQRLAGIMGAPDRTVLTTPESLVKVGLSARVISPYSDHWSSRLDASRAKTMLDFRHRPLDQYLNSLVAAFLSHMPSAPPPGYHDRDVEIRAFS